VMHKTIQQRRLLAAAAMAAVALSLAAGSADAANTAKKSSFCASDRDLAALNTRVLQTELMVAALSCGEKQRYNSFVTTHQAVLVDQGQALQALFKRAHGAQGANRMNAFVTKLANDASQQVRSRDDYCVFAVELFEEATASTPGQFTQVVNKPWIVDRHGYTPCVVQASRK